MYIPRALIAPIIISAFMFVAGVIMLSISLVGFAEAGESGQSASADQQGGTVAVCPTPVEGTSAADLVAALQQAGFDFSGEAYAEVGDFATNSGTIDDSLFTDGGFGDIGQQWREVYVDAPVTNVNVTGTDAEANVHIGDNVPAPSPSPAPSPAPAPEVAPPPPSPTNPPTPYAGSAPIGDAAPAPDSTPTPPPSPDGPPTVGPAAPTVSAPATGATT